MAGPTDGEGLGQPRIAGFLAWPALVADTGNVLTSAVTGNEAPPSRFLDRANALAAQNLLIDAVSRGRNLKRPTAPPWVQAEDIELSPAGRGRRGFTVRSVLAALRGGGVQPTRWARTRMVTWARGS